MSIYKIINGRNQELSRLKECSDYIKNPEKNSCKLHGVTGLSYENAVEDMLTVKTLCNQLVGRQFIHSVISFDTGVSSIKAHEVGCEVLRYYEGKYQILMEVHDNTDNVHCHFQLNTVSCEGKKFTRGKNEMLAFRKKINDILKFHGLRPIQRMEEISWDEMEQEEDEPFTTQRVLYHANYRDESDCEEMDSEEDIFVNPLQHEVMNPCSHVSVDEWDSLETLAYGRLLKLKAAEEIARIKEERNGEVRAVYHEYPDEPWWEV